MNRDKHRDIAEKVYYKIIDVTVFLYFALAAVILVYFLVNDGIAGIVNAFIILFATAFIAFSVLVVIGMLLNAIWGRYV